VIASSFMTKFILIGLKQLAKMHKFLLYYSLRSSIIGHRYNKNSYNANFKSVCVLLSDFEISE